jgi:chromosome partitioning protein
MGAVLSVCSSKGGAGKSTLTLILAGALQAQGYTVRIIDADPAGRLVKVAEAGSLPDRVSVTKALEREVSKAIRAAADEVDCVIVDVAGTANLAIAAAAGNSDLTIVPANPSAPDVMDAVDTVELIRDMEETSRRKHPYALVWMRVPQFRSREMNTLEATVRGAGIPILYSIANRTAYQAMFSYSTTLQNLDAGDVPNLDKALAESTGLLDAVLEMIKQTADAA